MPLSPIKQPALGPGALLPLPWRQRPALSIAGAGRREEAGNPNDGGTPGPGRKCDLSNPGSSATNPQWEDSPIHLECVDGGI